MKILMITDMYPPIAVGGYEIMCKETADELKRRGHDVIILTSNWGIEQNSMEENVHRLLFFNRLNDPRKHNIKSPLRLRKRYYQICWWRESRRNYEKTCEFITATKPDLAFFWNMGNIGVGPILAAQTQSIPQVFNVGDYWLLRLKHDLCDDPNFLRKKFQATINGLKDFSQLELKHLLIVSETLKRSYIQNGFSEQNIRVIPLGVQSSLILPIESLQDHRNKSTLKFLFVGRIVPTKAPDVAIDAFNILIQRYGINYAQLDFIGQGSEEYTSELRKKVFELNLDEKIKFLGWMDHLNILSKYQDYDALLFPSRWEEPFGMTVLEAMARGLPVIASGRGGPLEIIDNGKNGVLIPPNNPAALAEAMLQMIQNESLVQKIRVAAIKTLTERYTLEYFVDKNLEYIQAVTSCASD